MDSTSSFVKLLIIMSFLCLQSKSETSSGSVLFIDSPTHQYLRTSPSDQSVQANSMSAIEVGAALSVLLGLAPSPMLSTASASKLNDLLMPNPFDRPRHVFMLEVPLAQDSQATIYPHSALLSGAINSKVISSSGSVEIELPDKEEVAFFSFGGPDSDCKSMTDKEISDFAQSFGGSYISNNLEGLDGELIIILPSGLKLNLHMSKKADREFVGGLICMTKNIGKVMEMNQEFSGRNSNAAELVGGYFNGIKALQKEYGSKGIAEQAMDLLLATVSKVSDSLQARHRGHMVTVILFNNAHSSQSQKILDVTFDSRPSPRWLEEVKISPNSTAMAEVALVRITLAWITGIVLLIATFIGVYLLLNMPLTRDTLLYSNVKLD